MSEKSDKEKGEIGNPLYCSYVEGLYTYKDPTSLNEFVWDEDNKLWKPKKVAGQIVQFDGESYTYHDSDGTCFQWDPSKSAWFPKDSREGFRNPNYERQEEGQPRRFYYAALSPSEMGVNEPVLFLSPDDQANNNSTLEEKPSELPSGWERHDDANGPYYWHIKSGTIQREPPTPGATSPPPANPALLIPGSLENPTPFRRSQTSSQLSSKETREKRRSWSQFLEGPPVDKDSLHFVGVSLGFLGISEEDLTPERSSRAVSKIIAELSSQHLFPNSLEVAGKIWGGGSELYIELNESHLKIVTKEGLTVTEQPIHSIRVWGVGRDDPRDFAYVAREKQTRQFLCHVFRLELNARPLASALRDACKKIMIERQAKQKRPTTLPCELRKAPQTSPSFFPTPMDEPRKVLHACYLGSKIVNKPTGMETLNAAIDFLRAQEPIPVSVSVAPSVVTVIGEETKKVNVEIRVRYLSFMGIGRDVQTCGVIVHTARDEFEAHCFYSTPSSGALCKAIEAACVLRWQKCLDSHGSGGAAPPALPATTPKTAANLAATFKSVLASFSRSKSEETKN